jgi:hypothetical protein
VCIAAIKWRGPKYDRSTGGAVKDITLLGIDLIQGLCQIVQDLNLVSMFVYFYAQKYLRLLCAQPAALCRLLSKVITP